MQRKSINAHKDISITAEKHTSHLIRGYLTPRKEGRLHSQSTRKKKRRKSPDTNTGTAQRRQTFFKLHTPIHQTKPRDNLLESQEHVQVTYVTLKHTYRLDVMHAGDTNQTTSTQTLLSPNALALLHLTTTTQQTYIHLPRQKTTQLAHSKTPRNVQ